MAQASKQDQTQAEPAPSVWQRIREEAGLTHAEMAAELGVSRQRIQFIEANGGTLTGTRCIDAKERFRKEMRKLKISLDDLIQA